MQRTNSWLQKVECNIFHTRVPVWHQRCFSMLELLIVIAILVILISLLLPALRKAREQAQTITCCNQQRSILQGGIMSHNQNDISLKQSMIENSQQVILLCDHTKFNSYAFMHVAPLEKFDIVITGKELDKKYVSALNEKGIVVELV